LKQQDGDQELVLQCSQEGKEKGCARFVSTHRKKRCDGAGKKKARPQPARSGRSLPKEKKGSTAFAAGPRRSGLLDLRRKVKAPGRLRHNFSMDELIAFLGRKRKDGRDERKIHVTWPPNLSQRNRYIFLCGQGKGKGGICEGRVRIRWMAHHARRLTAKGKEEGEVVSTLLLRGVEKRKKGPYAPGEKWWPPRPAITGKKKKRGSTTTSKKKDRGSPVAVLGRGKKK